MNYSRLIRNISTTSQGRGQRKFINPYLIDQLLKNMKMANVSAEEDDQFEDMFFGILLLVCGLLAAIANALVLFIAIRNLRSRNVLFIIITNFALIDEVKSIFAIYMGLTYFLARITHSEDDLHFYKYQQVTLYMTFKTFIDF